MSSHVKKETKRPMNLSDDDDATAVAAHNFEIMKKSTPVSKKLKNEASVMPSSQQQVPTPDLCALLDHDHAKCREQLRVPYTPLFAILWEGPKKKPFTFRRVINDPFGKKNKVSPPLDFDLKEGKTTTSSLETETETNTSLDACKNYFEELARKAKGETSAAPDLKTTT